MLGSFCTGVKPIAVTMLEEYAQGMVGGGWHEGCLGLIGGLLVGLLGGQSGGIP